MGNHLEVHNVKKSYACTDVAVRTSNWTSEDNRHVEFFRIHMLFTPLWLILVTQYFISQSLMVDSNFLRRHDKSLVVHLLEPAMKRCLNMNIDKQLKNVCKFGIHKRTERKNFSPKNQTLRSPLKKNKQVPRTLFLIST